MTHPVIAAIATTPHNGKQAEIFAERGLPETGTSPFFLTALTTHEGRAKGFAIPVERDDLLSFAWAILRELEFVDG